MYELGWPIYPARLSVEPLWDGGRREFTQIWCGPQGGREWEVDEYEEVRHDADHKPQQNDGISASPHCETPQEPKQNPS